MRIFVTGATGFVGSAVVQDLLAAGHQVVGLARSDASANTLRALGVAVQRGDLQDLASLRQGAAQADGVIHTAFNHDFSQFQANCEQDRQVITALGDELAGSSRPLVITSGLGLLANVGLATEATRMHFGPDAHPRSASEAAGEALAERGVHVSVVRLPPTVHGQGDHGFVPILINLAREKGVSAYLEAGQNCWPAVHRLDAARLFRLAAEKGSAQACYHAAAEEGIPFKVIAEAIGKGLDVPVQSKSGVAVAEHFDWFAAFAAMDVRASSQQTRQELGWQPTQIDLMADLAQAYYFTH